MFRSRDHLIRHVAKCPLRPSICRAIDDPYGKVELLGGFKIVPPGDRPGFILAVTSQYKRTWFVAAVIPKQGFKPVVRVIDEVPWGYWVGDEGAKNPLYAGDNPNEYEKKKSIQRRSASPPAKRRLS